jgi:hypothetical protein
MTKLIYDKDYLLYRGCEDVWLMVFYWYSSLYGEFP